jgi:hypothetical protein
MDGARQANHAEPGSGSGLGAELIPHGEAAPGARAAADLALHDLTMNGGFATMGAVAGDRAR